jgi:hypothetical protein
VADPTCHSEGSRGTQPHLGIHATTEVVTAIPLSALLMTLWLIALGTFLLV